VLLGTLDCHAEEEEGCCRDGLFRREGTAVESKGSNEVSNSMRGGAVIVLRVSSSS